MIVSAPVKNDIALLATGIINSGSLWKQQPREMQLALAKYDEILNGAIKKQGGVVFSTPGNALFAAFDTPLQALMAAYSGQAAMSGLDWAELSEPLQVSMAIHFGEVKTQNNRYTGPGLEQLKRLQAVGTPGTILVSTAAKEKLAEAALPENVHLADAGQHRLQDLTRSVRLYHVEGEALPSGSAPVRSLESWPQNLPVHATGLIGREKEVAQAVEMLTRHNARLITFTGPGGTGKTRLSLQVAAEMLFDFPDGVFVVELAGIAQASQVAMAINRTLGLKEVSGRELLENLKSYLRERQVLLVLDNFEQVVSAAPLVSDLLAAAPRLKILVSSRIVLKIYGEQEFQVPPLGLPGPGKSADLKELATTPAIELLVERVRQVLPNFSLNEHNAPVISQICARLDGLPLAIELAAVRFKMFKPEIILSGLVNRLQLLVNETGDRSVAHHQQTLRGAIDWSYSLLDESEKLLFTRLGIFAGGFTAEVAETVCNPDFDPDLDTLDNLTSLLDHSLVRFLTPPGEDEPRFGMLETIREFALEKLKQRNEQTEVARSYARYFLELAEEAEPQLTGPDQVAWYKRLGWEYPNLREVIEQAMKDEENQFEVALRITSALWRFWTARGYLAESREWLEKVLIRNTPNRNPASAGYTTTKASQESRATLYAKGYNAAGLLALEEGDLNQAKAMLEEALRLHSPRSGPAILTNTLNALGTVESYLGNFEQALEYHQRCLKLRRESNDTRGIAISLCNLGAVEGAQNQLVRSRQYYEEALSLLRRVGDKRTMALLLNNIGNLWLTQDDLDKARQATEESLKIYRDLEDQGGIALALMQMADIARLKNDAPEAIDLYRQSLKLFEEVGEKADLPPCFEGLAAALAKTGNLPLATRLYGAAHKLRETLDMPLQPAEALRYEQELGILKQQLSEEEFSTEWSAGNLLDIEDAFKAACG